MSWFIEHWFEALTVGLLGLIAYQIGWLATTLKGLVYDLGQLRRQLEMLQASVESIDTRGNRLHPERDWPPD
jgi:hypothetical protein